MFPSIAKAQLRDAKCECGKDVRYHLKSCSRGSGAHLNLRHRQCVSTLMHCATLNGGTDVRREPELPPPIEGVVPQQPLVRR